MSLPDTFLGFCPFTDGTRRPIYADGDRQYTYDNDGERVYGVFLLSEEDRYDLPVIVDAADARTQQAEK